MSIEYARRLVRLAAICLAAASSAATAQVTA